MMSALNSAWTPRRSRNTTADVVATLFVGLRPPNAGNIVLCSAAQCFDSNSCCNVTNEPRADTSAPDSQSDHSGAFMGGETSRRRPIAVLGPDVTPRSGEPARVPLRVSSNWSGQKHALRRRNGPYSRDKSTRFYALYFP